MSRHAFPLERDLIELNPIMLQGLLPNPTLCWQPIHLAEKFFS
jgi:hypothetical protein